MFSTPFSFMASAAAPPPPPPPVVQCFTSNGTWSCCTGTTCIEVVTIGAGGGGGQGACNSATCFAGGAGGGAGGVSICTICSGFGTTQCVIVGVGGCANTQLKNTNSQGRAGGNGGATCFGALVCAGGGAGGVGAQTATNSAAGGAGNQGTSSCGGREGCVNSGPTFRACNGGSSSGKPGGGGGAESLFVGGSQAHTGCLGGAGSTICGITLGCGGNAGRTASGCFTTVGRVGNGKTNPSCFGGGGAGGGGGATFTGGIDNDNYNGSNGFQGIIQVTQFFT